MDRRCDALIVHAEAVSDEYLIELAGRDVELVLVNRHIPELAERCFYTDNELGGYLATEALLQRGHRDIAYISGPLFKLDAKARLAGHQKALAEYNVSFDPKLSFEGGYHETDGIAGFNHLMQTGQRFSALVCANDEMASGAMTAAREAGLDVPSGLSVVGFDDVLFTKYLYPKLTTIDNPIRKMGNAAARWVLKHVYKEKHQPDVENLYPPTLILRDSIAVKAE